MTNEQQQQFTCWLDADIRRTAEAISWVKEQFDLNYSESGMRQLVKHQISVHLKYHSQAVR